MVKELKKIINRPIVKRIKRIIQENYRIKTFVVEADGIAEKAKPGQFIMIWIPGVDEIPMSISNIVDNEVWITVAKVGDATTALHEKKVGDKIGVRGPYGTPFSTNYKKIAIVGGGYGVAPLTWLAEIMKKKGSEIHFFFGAKTKEDIVLMNRIEKAATQTYITTEDGSMGYKGFVTDILEEELKKIKPEAIYTCGPEEMMLKVINLAIREKIHIEASFERYMMCGIGVCGTCTIGPLRVCIEGPIFTQKEITKILEYILQTRRH